LTRMKNQDLHKFRDCWGVKQWRNGKGENGWMETGHKRASEGQRLPHINIKKRGRREEKNNPKNDFK